MWLMESTKECVCTSGSRREILGFHVDKNDYTAQYPKTQPFSEMEFSIIVHSK